MLFFFPSNSLTCLIRNRCNYTRIRMQLHFLICGLEVQITWFMPKLLVSTFGNLGLCGSVYLCCYYHNYHGSIKESLYWKFFIKRIHLKGFLIQIQRRKWFLQPPCARVLLHVWEVSQIFHFVCKYLSRDAQRMFISKPEPLYRRNVQICLYIPHV